MCIYIEVQTDVCTQNICYYKQNISETENVHRMGMVRIYMKYIYIGKIYRREVKKRLNWFKQTQKSLSKTGQNRID